MTDADNTEPAQAIGRVGDTELEQIAWLFAANLELTAQGKYSIRDQRITDEAVRRFAAWARERKAQDDALAQHTQREGM